MIFTREKPHERSTFVHLDMYQETMFKALVAILMTVVVESPLIPLAFSYLRFCFCFHGEEVVVVSAIISLCFLRKHAQQILIFALLEGVEMQNLRYCVAHRLGV